MDGIACKRTYHKPFTHGETSSAGDLGYSQCDNDASWIRDLWLGAFTGMCTAPLLWENQHRTDLWIHFGRLNSFVSGYDFNEDGGWVAYHDYDEVHWENWQRKPGIVDLFYLRSPDEKRAVGVLGNRTYNFYTQRDNTKCGTFVWSETSDSLKFELLNNTETWDDQAYNYPRSAHYINESMQVDVKSKKTYVITYINPLTMQVVDSEEKYNLTGKLNLSFPYLTGNVDRPILLFTVELKNKNKSTENYLDSIQHSLDQIAIEFQCLNSTRHFFSSLLPRTLQIQ
ncbi:MAG: hypothetical protein JXR53_09395 [Bacteroidales bacterium]|nr:hypothetical protein [Bacteroidales bacterium]